MHLHPTSPRRAAARPMEAGRAASWVLVLLALLCVPLVWLVLGGEEPTEAARSNAIALREDRSASEGASRTTLETPQVQRESSATSGRRDPRELELDPELELELDEEFPTGVFGRVTDSAGAPVGGVLCEALDLVERRRVGVGRSTANGEFTLRGLAVEDGDAVTLRLAHPEFAATILDDIELAAGVLIPVGTLVLYTPSSLSGVCIDEATGKPVAGAVLTPLLSFEGSEIALEAQATTTDAQGSYRLGGLSGGFLRIHARAPGYATRLLEMIGLSGAEAREGYRVRLRAAPPLEGRVEDASGRPLAGIAVRYEPRPSPALDLERETARSDAEGRFRILSPDPERGYWLAVDDRRFLSATQQSASYDASEQRLVLTRGARLRVLLEGGDGSEPSLALESAIKSDQAPNPSLFRPVDPSLARLEKANGGFETGALDPRSWYRVSARCGERFAARSEPIEIDPSAEEPQIVRLRFDAEARLRLRIVDEAGAPVAGALVRVTRAGDVLALRSAVDGSASCGAAGGGDFEIDLEKEGFAPLLDQVLLVPPAGLTQDYVLSRGGRLHGRVTIGGAPPPRPLQVWIRTAGLDFQRRTTTGEDGAYAFDGLPLDESYELFPLQGLRSNTFSAERFSHPIEDDDRFAFDEEYEFTVDLEAEQPEKLFDMNLPRVPIAQVKGVVRDASGPRAGLAVIGILFESGVEVAALTDAEGRFRLEIAGAGDLDLEVRAQSGEALLWVDHLELQEAQELELEILLRTAKLAVAVLDDLGQAVSGSRVRAKLQAATGGGPNTPIGAAREAHADMQGRVSFDGLPEGRYDFEATAPGFALGVVRQREILSSAEGEQVEIRLPRAALAELLLRNESGERLVQPVNLEIYDATGAPVPFRDGTPRATIRGGELRLDHLTVGGYRFVLSRSAMRLERYADLLGGDEPQKIEWRVSLGGGGGEIPPGEQERKDGARNEGQDDEKREKGR
ncbi:MAG: carboxypeptidase regulatory-like domain-containing protein [Planctomycetes bacterium]|nr:carboxypeptidase regulatory-like domain-containing protein [Planctomycetota bacterium]